MDASALEGQLIEEEEEPEVRDDQAMTVVEEEEGEQDALMSDMPSGDIEVRGRASPSL
jgi:hypothetical protein